MAKKTNDLKITDEQLKLLQERLKMIQSIQSEVGIMETRKFSLLNQVAMVQAELQKQQAQLEEEYGKVTINVADGTIKEIEDEADTKD